VNFKPELAAKVMAGEKTVTRRLTSTNERSPWFVGRCSLKVGADYAVCPGRGKNAIGRVKVTEVWQERLSWLTPHEVTCEGFASIFAFEEAWKAINGRYDPNALVWRVEFEAVA
jgi:hypothetical protein